jgi:hypothetical protein
MKNLPNKLIKKFCRLDKNGNTLLTPFTISKEKKVIFFHIAKTGGSSIYDLLSKNGFNEGILSNKKLDYDIKVKYFSDILDQWDEYYKFTFVRNKYDQLVSLYNYDKALLNQISFEDFIIKHVCNISEYYPNYDYWIDQHFLTTVDNNPIFDFVGNFNNYRDDLKYVCGNINIEYEDIRKNIGTYDRNKKYADYYTPQLKALVDKKFEKEIEYFDWESE